MILHYSVLQKHTDLPYQLEYKKLLKILKIFYNSCTQETLKASLSCIPNNNNTIGFWKYVFLHCILLWGRSGEGHLLRSTFNVPHEYTLAPFPLIFNMHEVDNSDNCCSFLKESAASMNVYIRKSVALVLALSQEASNYLYHQWWQDTILLKLPFPVCTTKTMAVAREWGYNNYVYTLLTMTKLNQKPAKGMPRRRLIHGVYMRIWGSNREKGGEGVAPRGHTFEN